VSRASARPARDHEAGGSRERRPFHPSPSPRARATTGHETSNERSCEALIDLHSGHGNCTTYRKHRPPLRTPDRAVYRAHMPQPLLHQHATSEPTPFTSTRPDFNSDDKPRVPRAGKLFSEHTPSTNVIRAAPCHSTGRLHDPHRLSLPPPTLLRCRSG